MNILNLFYLCLIYWTVIGAIFAIVVCKLINPKESVPSMWKVLIFVGGPIIWILLLIAKFTSKKEDG